jgi:hypothetical protein
VLSDKAVLPFCPCGQAAQRDRVNSVMRRLGAIPQFDGRAPLMLCTLGLQSLLYCMIMYALHRQHAQQILASRQASDASYPAVTPQPPSHVQLQN